MSEASVVHFSQLADAEPGSFLSLEWNTYRREVSRLLAEGQGGRFVLIKEETIVGIFESHAAAMEEGYKRFLRQPFLVHPIREYEPILCMRGYNLPWPVSPCPLAKPA